MMAPTGGASFKRKTSSVLWRLPEFVVKPEQDRLLVRFITLPGNMAKKGNVEIKFELAGRTASGVGVERLVAGKENDPFADEGDGVHEEDGSGGKKNWETVSSRLKLVSGRYTAS
jgi:F-BAR domain only protein